MSSGIEVTIDQAQLDAILGKLDPTVVRHYLRDLIKTAAKEGEDEARKLVVGEQDAGDAQAHYSMRHEAKPLSARIYSVMPEPRAMSIEVGRKPGEQAPFMQIYRWLFGRYRFTARNITPEQREKVLEVMRKIRESGTEGLYFIRGAAEHVEGRLPELLSDMARKIEEDFGR